MLGLRWTIGDVSDRGFRALGLALWGARQAFGADVDMAVVVNGVSIGVAREKTGEVPEGVIWSPAGGLGHELARHLDAGMAEGVAWKLAPLRLFPDRWELAFDNDCILWALPPSLAGWIGRDRRACVLAEDVERAFGAFDAQCGDRPLNTGIRGFPPGFDPEEALGAFLRGHPTPLLREVDEQGLQVAAFTRLGEPVVVTEAEVSICSPFWPKRPLLGTHGAHFVGLNARELPWSWYGRPASACQNENFDNWEQEIARRIGKEL